MLITIKQALQVVNGSLRREAVSLLAFICQQDISWVIAHPEYQLNLSENKIFKNKLKKLETGFPLAYIIGKQAFYNYQFQVSPAVLIPRPESELIIDIAYNYGVAQTNQSILFIDIGTGSGAIIISIAAEIQKKKAKLYKNSIFLASDISKKALNIANKNAQTYQVQSKIKFKSGNLLSPFKKELSSSKQRSIFIAANLPYLTPTEREEASIKYEPSLALIGGQDGLELYRELLKQQAQLIPTQSLCLVMEINPQQAEPLIKLSKQYFKKEAIKKVPDLSGQTRFILINRS